MITLKEAFLEKYPKYENILRMFKEANECNAEWDELSKLRIIRFIEYMNERVSPNSARQYAAKLKAVINRYSEEVKLGFDFASILTLKEQVSVNTFLDEKEINSLIQLEIQSDTERLIRDQFVLGCITGARHSDFCQFTKENIQNGWLSYVSQKTKVFVEIPVAPILKRFIKEKSPALSDRIVSDVYFNDTIRKLAEEAGITVKTRCFKAGKNVTGRKCDLIASHTARRSCASNLAARGVSEVWIKKILGHTRGTTDRYICLEGRRIPKEAKGYFLSFK
ncbi:tyrosine-type recombinase/integrase [uncultured Parabacteroides sp.]|uniref:tyrosine-type recombinase/integrase n=1 Tax=uncultured Parabacteroides sp. TaxID=512312 RepID=UPI0025E69B25|nr:tyrosine-type recombinase/integrase [uncultured Parabacteroides sp.]